MSRRSSRRISSHTSNWISTSTEPWRVLSWVLAGRLSAVGERREVRSVSMGFQLSMGRPLTSSIVYCPRKRQRWAVRRKSYIYQLFKGGSVFSRESPQKSGAANYAHQGQSGVLHRCLDRSFPRTHPRIFRVVLRRGLE